ncbi:MAG: membrane protein insertion efficiency factor YidD [Halioglobus sp.]
MRRIAIFLIYCYKTAISPFLGDHCRFYPNCSTYAQEAIATYGVLKGSWMAAKRLSKCHPWHEGGIDLVPPCSHSH